MDHLLPSTDALLQMLDPLVQQRTGIDLAEMNRSMLRGAVTEHMQKIGAAEFSTYCQMLHGTATRIDELSEQLAVIESWFFRDVGPFDLLAQFASSWSQPRRLRVLSMPCAGGEEPYSAAMTLLKAGLTPAQFEIQAVDLSRIALRTARSGLYTKHSFRTDDVEFRDHFFTRAGERYRLDQRVVDCVSFSGGNIMDPLWVQRMGAFDVVFCRNLLIYFGLGARRRAWGHLDSLMVSGGLLFVGSAELGQFAEVPTFTRTDPPRCFALRKMRPERKQPASTRSQRPTRGQTDSPTHAPGRAPSPVPPFKSVPTVVPVRERTIDKPSATTSDHAVLDEAERLADEGKFAEASSLIVAYLNSEASKPRPYYLLALIRTAENDDAAAEELLSKALYLDPGYHDALVHLSSLVRRRGDEAQAQHLEERARRCEGEVMGQ